MSLKGGGVQGLPASWKVVSRRGVVWGSLSNGRPLHLPEKGLVKISRFLPQAGPLQNQLPITIHGTFVRRNERRGRHAHI